MISPLSMRYSWATAGQLECIQLFVDLVGGHHNLESGFIDIGQDGVCITQKRSMATFDGDWLTKLVFLAHSRCIRAELQAGGHGRLRVILHKRAGRDGRLMHRHPSLLEAINDFRASAIGKINYD